jgi:hypothetical protein
MGGGFDWRLAMTDVTATMDQTHELISSARVEGTPVFSPKGEKLGSVHSVMIHKTTGQVAYAVLEFGGLFGIGSHVHPIPWDRMAYDKGRRGYVTEITREQIEFLLGFKALLVRQRHRPSPVG